MPTIELMAILIKEDSINNKMNLDFKIIIIFHFNINQI